MRHLNDQANAFLAFERSTMLIDAIKNPLIYLNFAIYCWRTNRIELAQLHLRNFYQMSDNMAVRPEVCVYSFDDSNMRVIIDIFDLWR